MAANPGFGIRPRSLAITALVLLCINAAAPATAQPGLFGGPVPQAPGTASSAPGGNFGASAAANNSPGQGGAASADFDSLIDLIQSTVATETWAENGGGEAEIRPFPTGVVVDADGTLRQVKLASNTRDLGLLRQKPPAPATPQADSPRRSAALRYVSLPRLEQEIARRQSAGQPLDQDMLTLAGLRRVQFVFLYPETGDLVLAGPASDWYTTDTGRIVSVEDDQPMVRLDDLLLLLRREFQSPESPFGCAITPRQESLARTQAFLDESAAKPLRPGQRRRWLEELRSTLGQQDITIFGIDPTSRVAYVLVEADYHMKLIGMGLAEGVAGVESYLDSLEAAAGDQPPPMSVLRWWFAMSYQALRTTEEKDAFEFVGQGPAVLSENEMLTRQGERIHTGQSDPLTARFASRFTANFARICQRYPLYTELRNVFDLALVAALIQSEGLVEQVGWQPTLFLDAERLRLPSAAVPRQVDTVVNHRVINRRTIVAGISGGVSVSPRDILSKPRQTEDYGATRQHRHEVPADLAAAQWWWDFAE